MRVLYCCFFFSSRRRHTRYWRDWSSDVCSSDLRSPRLGDRRVVPHGACLPDPRGRATRGGGRRRLSSGPVGLRRDWKSACRERVEISVVAVSLKKKSNNTTPPSSAAHYAMLQSS